jgi:hypothetical protein
MEVMKHLLEGGHYSEDEFYWAHHCSALFLLRGAHALAKENSGDNECENCECVSDLMNEYFEAMEKMEEAFRKDKGRGPAEKITLDALRDRLSLGQLVIIYDTGTMEKLRFRIVEELPKTENSQVKLPKNAKQVRKAA